MKPPEQAKTKARKEVEMKVGNETPAAKKAKVVEETPDRDESKPNTKTVFIEAKKCKAKHSTAMNAASNLLSSIGSSGAWAWAANDVVPLNVKKAVQQVEKHTSEFAKEFLTVDFVAFRNHHSDVAFLTGALQKMMKELNPHIDLLHQETYLLLGMHSRRQELLVKAA